MLNEISCLSIKKERRSGHTKHNSVYREELTSHMHASILLVVKMHDVFHVQSFTQFAYCGHNINL